MYILKPFVQYVSQCNSIIRLSFTNLLCCHHPVPPGLPLVTVRPMGNGLVVSCTPSVNGDPPASYDITVEPNGTHIITASNGMVEQNIPGLLPNTTYTVRVIAINCAGSSGVVAVNAITG